MTAQPITARLPLVSTADSYLLRVGHICHRLGLTQPALEETGIAVNLPRGAKVVLTLAGEVLVRVPRSAGIEHANMLALIERLHAVAGGER